MAGRDRGLDGTVMVAGDDFLTLRRVEVAQIGFGLGAGAVAVHHRIHHGDDGLGLDADRG